MFKQIAVIALLIVACISPRTVFATEAVTQRDLMLELVNGLGWSFGLPDTPEDEDYLRILSGKRQLRLELETMTGIDTPLISKDIFTFGNFSGNGWLQGPIKPSSETFTFLLPQSGTYKVKARVMKKGFVLAFDQTRLTADSDDRLSDHDCGEVTLSSGPQQLTIDVPSRGGIDFVDLEAFPSTPIEPPGGWQLTQSLTTTDLAVVALQILKLENNLPQTATPVRIEAENLQRPNIFQMRNDIVHGNPSGGAWVESSSEPSTWYATFRPPRAGFFALTVTSTGRAESFGLINDTTPLLIPASDTFQTTAVGGFLLHEGDNRLTLSLSPLTGIDYLELTALEHSPEALGKLAGLGKPAPATRKDLDRVIRLLAAFGIRR